MKKQCKRCKEWYTTDHGLFISRPTGWDHDLCKSCNREIDAKEQRRKVFMEDILTTLVIDEDKRSKEMFDKVLERMIKARKEKEEGKKGSENFGKYPEGGCIR